jgi:hypothetical protein
LAIAKAAVAAKSDEKDKIEKDKYLRNKQSLITQENYVLSKEANVDEKVDA